MEIPELPECPVCLQSYDGDTTIPRVLSCGHSACGACLTRLPQPFPHTIRCPACTQLVKYPHPQGSSALPKNIDLLRLSSLLIKDQNLSKGNDRTQKRIEKDGPKQFIPNLWTHDFYQDWKDWIVPNDAVLVESSTDGDGFCSVLSGKTVNSSALIGLSMRCLMKENKNVSLVRVGSFSSENDDSKFSYSYVARIVKVLYGMTDGQRDELSLILKAGLRQTRICKVYGFWCNASDQGVYIVCERYGESLVNKLGNFNDEIVGGNEEKIGPTIGNDVCNFAMIGREICEAVSSLHLEGLVSGFLTLSSFNVDYFGHLYVDFSEVLTMGRKVRQMIAEAVSGRQKMIDNDELDLEVNVFKTFPFVCPELLLVLLQQEGVDLESRISPYASGYGVDVWSLACLLLQLLIGEPFNKEMDNYFSCFINSAKNDKDSEFFDLYIGWMDKVKSFLKTKMDPKFEPLEEILCRSLEFDPASRPAATDLWRCIGELIIKSKFDVMASLRHAALKDHKAHCLALGELCQLPKEIKIERQMVNLQGDSENGEQIGESKINRDVVDGLSGGHVKYIDLKGHRDCITGLAFGGGFLFSSSYDKTVKVWSLQDFTHLHSFKGHEQRIMGIALVEEPPLCISGDSGGGIFIWSVQVPFAEEPLKKLYEQKDWRYSGIHALAVSGTGYFYTGSGDKSIKAWSLQDYTLSFTMHGHKSAVSTLAVCNGVLYSGSWDGTIRLWSLSDHSPLTVLGEDVPGNMSPVLSIATEQHVLVVAHENGFIKIWSNDVFLKSTQPQKGAIFSISMEGKWVFSGGLDKTVNVQELSGHESQMEAIFTGSVACDSVITVLLYREGKLFIGQADRVIKDQVTGEPIPKGPKMGSLFTLFLPVPILFSVSFIQSFACNNVPGLSMV